MKNKWTKQRLLSFVLALTMIFGNMSLSGNVFSTNTIDVNTMMMAVLVHIQVVLEIRIGH